MDGGRVYGGSDLIALLDNPNNSLWVPPSSSPSFHETMVNFNYQEAQQGKRRRSPNWDEEDTGGEESEINPYRLPEKKRRLSHEQVQSLEKSFEVDNKLEPERKVQLAKALGLQPRQVAIWFQNRRARFKTKQLEKDYDSLKANFDRLKASFDTLIKERDDLQKGVKLLTNKLKQWGIEGMNLDPGSPRNPFHLDSSHEELPKMEIGKMPKMEIVGMAPSNKHLEDVSSAKSDIFDSESPHCTEGNHSSQLEGPADSPHMPGRDQQSDCSPEEEDEDRHLINMEKNLLFPPAPPALFNNSFLKVEDNECYDPICITSAVDDQPFWSCLY